MSNSRTHPHARRLLLFTVALLSLFTGLIGLVPITAGAQAGDFSLDLAAAAPNSYDHLTGGGAFDDGTIGKSADVVESLEAAAFACGDIVTFFTQVTVDDTAQAATDAPQTIQLDYEFLMDTTGQPGVAIGDIVSVGVNDGTIQDLIPGENAVDDGNVGDGGSVATLIAESQTAPMFSKGAKLLGTIQVTDLERAETVIVRIDTKLFCQPGANQTGNLQAALTAARLTFVNGTTAVTPPATISAGNQTIPFSQFGELNVPEIVVQKTVTTAGGTCPGSESISVNAGEQVKYCYVVTNPSNTTNPPGAPLYNVTLVDDNGTPTNTADDFAVTLTGLTDVDLDGTADDLAAGGTAGGSALRTMSTVGTIVNTATATGYDSIIYSTAFTDTDTASVTVNPPPPVAPQPRVIKGAVEGNDTVATLNEPGGSVTINVVVHNDAPAGTGDATLTALTDDLYGNITTTGHNGITATTCATGGVVAGGSSYPCSFTVAITSQPATIVDTVTATLQNTHSSVSDTDQANVVVRNLAPTIDVTKTASPTAVPETGGDVTFTFRVANTSTEPVTITSLTDSVYGALAGDADCKVGTVLAAGASCEFSITMWVEGDDSGPDHVNVVTAKAVDDDGTEATDTDDATVGFTDVAPLIRITKTANPTEVSEVGDLVLFTILIENIGEEDVTLTELTDSVFGDLDGEGTCQVPQTIAVDESYTCTFRVRLGSDSLESHRNVATAIAEDDDGTEATDDDDATVTFADELPSISIAKTASPSTVHAGDTVTYTYEVRNTGFEPIAKVTVTDDKCAPVTFVGGDSDGDGKLDTTEIWAYRCTTALTGTTTNVATAIGEDDDGNTDTATDTETVTVINPAIVIVKEPDDGAVTVGARVIFTYTVTNPGNDALANVAVVDDRCSPVTLAGGDADGDGKLDPGESWTFTCTTTMAEVGAITNIGTVTGTDALGKAVSATDTATVDVSAVLGVVLERPLPRTGAYVLRWAGFSILLIVAGATMTLSARRRRLA